MPATDSTTTPAAPGAADDAAPPAAGEQTRAQTANFPGGIVAGGMMLAGGSPMLFGAGSLSNPCNYPGYAEGYWGWYGHYRFALELPTLRLARAIKVSPVLASPWTYEHDDAPPKQLGPSGKELAKRSAGKKPARPKPVKPGEPPEVPEPLEKPEPSPADEQWAVIIDKVTRTFDRLREAFVADAVRIIDYGWAPFEPVWELDDDGHWVSAKLKPLLVDTTTILVDLHGNFFGLRPSASPLVGGVGADATTDVGPSDLLASKGKALVVTYDGEAGHLYGRSQLHNVLRTAFRDWLDTTQQIQALAGKVSGRQAYAIVPSGGYQLPNNGGFRSYADDAVAALTAFAQGRQPVLTSPSLGTAMAGGNVELALKLAGNAPVTFEVVDFGTESAAIAGLLDRLRHNEELMFQGYLMPSRVGQEGQNGTKAEAETHTDTALVNSQLLGNDIARQVQPILDRMLATNWGLKPGTIRVKQAPLVDSQRETFTTLLNGLMADDAFKSTLMKVMDMDKVVDGLGVPRDGDWDEVADHEEQKQAALTAQDAHAGRQHELALAGAKGGGDEGTPPGNGRMAAAGKGSN